MFLTLPSEPDRGMNLHAACLPQASSISAVAFAGVHPSQRTWSNSQGSDHHPVGHISNLLGLGGALPQLSPHTSLFHRALSPGFHQMPLKYFSFGFFVLYWCIHTSCVWRLPALSWIKLLFEDISCTCCALSYSPQNFWSQRIKSQ